MRKLIHRSMLAASVATMLAPVGAPVLAQTETVGLEEIIVTAQRKSERLQDVPIAVNVIGGDELAQRGLTKTEQLQASVPGLEFPTQGGAGTPFLRGIGSNAGNPNDEPSVATYVDGVYIASSYANRMAFNSVERVEVLKGPQGTLFGRNATGGVIQIVTRDPEHDPSVEVNAGYGNYQTWTGSLYATTGLGEHAAVDLAVGRSKQDEGWGRNVTLNEETYKEDDFSVRSKLLLTPTDQLTFRLAADYMDVDSNVAAYTLPPGVLGVDGQPPAERYDTRGVITLDNIGQPRVVTRQKGASLRAEYETDLGQLVSISAYRKAEGEYDAEADTTPLPVVNARLPTRQRNFSQELQWLSPQGSSFDWVVGLYYYDNKAGYENGVFNGLAFSNPPFSSIATLEFDGMQQTKSKSAYAQGTVPIFEGTKLTAGLRYTDEDQSLDAAVFDIPFPEPDRGFEEWTWRVALDHEFSSAIHSYVSYNRGVKGGGYDPLPLFGEGFAPEVLDAYEIGLKSELLDRRLRLNAAVFYYDYQNIQVQVVPAGQAQAIAITTNAAKAEIKGVDVDFQFAPIDNLVVSGGFAIIDGEYKDFDNAPSFAPSPLDPPVAPRSASGNDTIRTPKWAATLTLEYRIQSAVGEFPLNITGSHSDGYFFGADNRLKQEPYSLLNASAGWNSSNDHFGVTVWGNNLADEYYYVQGVPSALGDLVVPAAPRTYGVNFRVKFGR